jgi:hypothetical protein
MVIYPGRSLRILAMLVLLFSVPYIVALSRGNGIMAVWPKELNRHNDPDAKPGKSIPVTLKPFFSALRRRMSTRLGRAFKDICHRHDEILLQSSLSVSHRLAGI